MTPCLSWLNPECAKLFLYLWLEGEACSWFLIWGINIPPVTVYVDGCCSNDSKVKPKFLWGPLVFLGGNSVQLTCICPPNFFMINTFNSRYLVTVNRVGLMRWLTALVWARYLMNVHIFQYRPEVLTEITALEMSLTIFNTLQVYSFDSFVSSVANPCLVLRLFVSCRPSAGGFLQFFFPVCCSFWCLS